MTDQERYNNLKQAKHFISDVIDSYNNKTLRSQMSRAVIDAALYVEMAMVKFEDYYGLENLS